MAYGTVKVDNITFDNGGSDQNVTVSGLYRATTSGVTVTGTISGAVLVGTTTVSGATVTGNVVQGTTVQGVSGTFTSLTGTTTTGTTANFASGVFTTRVSGTIITGDTGQFTSGTFVSLTGTTITGTTINAVTVSSTTGTFTSLTGTTITGTTINGVTVAATTGSFTSLTGTTTSGTTANFVSGVFTTQVSGTTVTGTTSNFTSGNFATLSGATATFTSGVIALGTATNPSLSFVGDPNTGIYSPGADQLAVATNGTQRLVVDSNGTLSVTSATAAVALITGPANAYIDLTDGTGIFRTQLNSNMPFIGAASNHGLALTTNNTERLRITSAGLVGIGTSAPQEALSVVGAVQKNITNIGGEEAGFIGKFEPQVGNTAGMYFNNILSINNSTWLSFKTTNGSNSLLTAMTIDASQRVGIGTTSPSVPLEVNGNARVSNLSVPDTNFIGFGAFTAYLTGSSATNFLSLNTGSTERARIDSSGRLLVGTSTDLLNGDAIQIAADSTNCLGLFSGRADTFGPRADFAKARGTTTSPGNVSSDDQLGNLNFTGYHGSYVDGAKIEAYVDGTPGANDMPGRLVFSTTADGSASPTERMRIQSDGNISIGSGASTTYRCAVAVASGADRDIFLGAIAGASNGLQVNWLHATTELSVKFNSIATTASAANAFLDSTDGNRIYRSTSSLRYKKDVEDIDQLKADAVLSLRPVWYRSNVSSDRQDWSWYGLIAEEVAQVEPRLVHWTYLDEDYETEIVNGEIKKTLKEGAQQVPDGVQYDRLTVLLLDVVKRQQQAIETLESKVAALESK